MRKTSVLLAASVLLATLGVGLYLLEKQAAAPLPDPEPDLKSASNPPEVSSAGTTSDPDNVELEVDEVDPALVQACVDSITADLARRLNKTELLNEDASEAVMAVATAELMASMHAAKMVLIESDDPEHLHVAALLEAFPEGDTAESLTIIASATASAPTDEFLAWDALRICMNSDRESGCGSDNWEARLLKLDGQNSEALIMIALNRLKKGDEPGALEAMQRAAVAPTSSGYFAERVLMTERALAASSNLAFAERSIYAVGVASSAMLDFQGFVQMCKEQSWRSDEWARACVAYAQTSERQARGIMTQQIGRAIQKESLMALGDDDRAEAIDTRSQEVRERSLERMHDVMQPLTNLLVMTDRRFFVNHFTAVSQYGETRAIAISDNETREWLVRYKDTACQQ